MMTLRRHPRYVKILLRGEFKETPPGFSLFSSGSQQNFRTLIESLRATRRHKRVRGLLLVVKDVSLDWSQIEEIQAELERLHQSGKRSWIFLEQVSTKNYYLACACGKIWMPRSAIVDLVGLQAEVLFFRDLLEMAGVEPEFFNFGEYKSAVEILTRNQMSEPNRRMTDSILEDTQTRVVSRIAQARQVSSGEVQEWFDRGPYTAPQAFEKGLIDTLLYEDQLEDALREEIAGLKLLPFSRLPVREGRLKRRLTFWRDQIAYIVVEGTITGGESRRVRSRQRTGSDTLRVFLKSARDKKKVKAVLLRVNSPGGAAVASDLIWREVKLTAEKKPVIVSFGGVAASGGYYIAMGASRIFAMPGTLTGSIGIIGGKVNARELLAKLRIGVDSIQKARRAGYGSPIRPYTEDEASAVVQQLSEFYDLFLARVAEGRAKSLEEVHEVAQGRVWTGSQAVERGLVDAHGGIVEALDAAREAAGIPSGRKVRIISYYKTSGLLGMLSPQLPGVVEGDRLWALWAPPLRIE